MVRQRRGCGFGDDPLYRAVSFLDASEGWVVGDGGWIRHTTDGGATWQEMYHPSSLSLRSVVAAAPGVAYIGGQTGSSCATMRPLPPPHPRPAGKPESAPGNRPSCRQHRCSNRPRSIGGARRDSHLVRGSRRECDVPAPAPARRAPASMPRCSRPPMAITSARGRPLLWHRQTGRGGLPGCHVGRRLERRLYVPGRLLGA